MYTKLVLKRVLFIIVFCCLTGLSFAWDTRIRQYLYTPSNQENPFLLRDSALHTVDPSLETKIIIHGFFENADRYWLRNIRRAYFERGNYNVILVDWSYWAIWRPFNAINNIPNVGLDVGDAILKLVSSQALDIKKVHIVGFSMGAHAAGFAGQRVYESLGTKITRITSLDGVGQYYKDVNDTERLSSDDADYVDVVHTSWVGRHDPYGTVDYYVNGKNFQKGCPDILTFERRSIFTFLIDAVINLVACSHERSHAYFIESINCKGITGTSCSSRDNFDKGLCKENTKTIFGEDAPVKDLGGLFYVTTNQHSPFNTSAC
ncbi:hepatic triacylglycerol lipase [Agrilus planipennis]|uniref:Hepatic triacylglycerol lipase n=1 Tax=Agrilus planipennis TaxID=224129 RepID=A0A1W4WWQ4_AGRPL|nr:hepatic triacylglycerol lipase [Agrilus planipennis]